MVVAKRFLNRIGWAFSIIVVDIILYLIIGLVIINYEGTYIESKGEYFSLQSMSLIEKVAFISYYLLVIINIILIAYFIYKIFKKYLIKK